MSKTAQLSNTVLSNRQTDMQSIADTTTSGPAITSITSTAEKTTHEVTVPNAEYTMSEPLSSVSTIPPETTTNVLPVTTIKDPTDGSTGRDQPDTTINDQTDSSTGRAQTEGRDLIDSLTDREREVLQERFGIVVNKLEKRRRNEESLSA